MSNFITIKLKHSDTEGAVPASLGPGEVAINTHDGVIFLGTPRGVEVFYQAMVNSPELSPPTQPKKNVLWWVEDKEELRVYNGVDFKKVGLSMLGGILRGHLAIRNSTDTENVLATGDAGVEVKALRVREDTHLEGNVYLNGMLMTSFPVGFVATYLGASAPAGWIEMAGQLLSIANYQALFNLHSSGLWLMTTTAAELASGHFRMVDARGQFPRFMDTGTNLVDYDKLTRTVKNSFGNVVTGATIGSMQDDAFKSHQHVTEPTYAGPMGAFGTVVSTPNPVSKTYGAGGSKNISQFPLSAGTGGSETRPKNIAFLGIIKT